MLGTFTALLEVGLALTLPAPNAAIPSSARPLAAALTRTERSLDAAIDRWDKSTKPPHDVTLLALYEQRIVRVLGERPTLARAVVRLDPAAADDVAARIDLTALVASGPVPRASPRVGPAAPAAQLLVWYREAQQRFGVRWQLLAAVNFVESAFGKVRNTSTAGAQGPMQFEASTWRAYGLGGNVHDPHDAILGAANYLAANHGVTRERDALYHYNPSRLYVDAVTRYAKRIAHDAHAFFRYYGWQVYFRTAMGYRRVTGPR
ncbi:MAG: transglycosylase SLT domain-containing protein [Gaiellaceae bacterium]